MPSIRSNPASWKQGSQSQLPWGQYQCQYQGQYQGRYQGQGQYQHGCGWLSATTEPQESSSASSSDAEHDKLIKHKTDDEDTNTVVTILYPISSSSGMKGEEQIVEITLIGTAHLSQRSNAQVQRLIEAIRPNVVLVELDPSRLHRIGIPSIESISASNEIQVVTSADIDLPTEYMNGGDDDDLLPLWRKALLPVWWFQEAVTEGFSRVARVFLTGMYRDMSEQLGNNEGGGKGGGGEEFAVAIRAAKACPDCHTLVLGDRSSLTTLKRAATLAWQSGDPLGVLDRLSTANNEELRQLEQRVRVDLLRLRSQNENDNDNKDDVELDKKEVNIAMMEALKEDSEFRTNLFRKLEQQVPEFTQAFLNERDYIMAEAIRRELPGVTSCTSKNDSDRDNDSKMVQRVVAVVGLAHVPGMEARLQPSYNHHPA